MRSPGKRAAPRHRAPASAGPDGADRPGGWRGLASGWRPRRGRAGVRRARPAGPRRRFGPAVRRLMVTPTFAAGLGVVVAASLAANMTKTVLHFSSPFPGTQCSAGVCTTEKPNSGTLASARPGVHIPRATGHSGDRRGGAGSAAEDGRQVTVTYQVIYQGQGGFIDEIRISGINEQQQSSWSLAFGYPGAQVTDVRGAQWQATSPSAGVAEGYAPRGAGGPVGPYGLGGRHGRWDGDSMVQFTVALTGSPMAPVGCDFDGTPCTFSAPGPH